MPHSLRQTEAQRVGHREYPSMRGGGHPRVQNGTVMRIGVIAFCSEMKTTELTRKQLSSVPCPTCGVSAGQRCVLVTGAPRKGPHVNRKLAATEVVEAERFKSAAD
jgi:hypothetical protein